MKNIFFTFVLSLLIFSISLISGCLPTDQLGTRSKSNLTISATPTTSHLNDNVDPDSVYWYSSGKKITGIVTVNANINTVVYLRGNSIHDFLKNNYYTNSNDPTLSTSTINQFCLVGDFSSSTSGAKQQLRIRAMPYSLNNLSSGGTERLFRIDLPSKLENATICSGNLLSEGTCRPTLTHDGLRNKTDCERASGTWEIGKCQITNYTTVATCTAAVGNFSWSENKCYNATYKTEVDCKNYKTRTPSLNIAWSKTTHPVNDPLSAFAPSTLCTNCTSILNLENVSLYKSSNNQIR